jgi:hypothetical protein
VTRAARQAGGPEIGQYETLATQFDVQVRDLFERARLNKREIPGLLVERVDWLFCWLQTDLARPSHLGHNHSSALIVAFNLTYNIPIHFESSLHNPFLASHNGPGSVILGPTVLQNTLGLCILVTIFLMLWFMHSICHLLSNHFQNILCLFILVAIFLMLWLLHIIWLTVS